MIVVIGSRHDPVAAALVAAWPDAALCSAEDFTRPGWIWRVGHVEASQWVVSDRTVADADVSGVFVRRSSVLGEEFASTHLEDRAYLATEVHAFLVFLLASTRAIVANPVHDGAFGDEALRPETWQAAARAAGLAFAPMRLSCRRRRPSLHPIALEMVGDAVFGAASEPIRAKILRLAQMLGLRWATFILDGRGRLLTVTTVRPLGAEATEALGQMLSGAST